MSVRHSESRSTVNPPVTMGSDVSSLLAAAAAAAFSSAQCRDTHRHHARVAALSNQRQNVLKPFFCLFSLTHFHRFTGC